MSDEKDKPPKPPKPPASVKGQRGFTKGVSGNPGGVPKCSKEMIMLARQGCEAAIRRLTSLVEDPDSHPLAAVAAARELLDRGYGRSAQIVGLTIDDAGMMNTGDGAGMNMLMQSALLQRAQLSKHKPSAFDDGDMPSSPSSSMPALTPEEKKITGLDVMLAQARASKNNNGKLASAHETLEKLVGKDRADELTGS